MSMHRHAALAAIVFAIACPAALPVHAQPAKPARAPASAPVREAVPVREAAPMKQRVVWSAPQAQCAIKIPRPTVKVSSTDGNPGYQPIPGQCVRIKGPGGTPVAGSPANGYPYTTPQFVSPPLALAAGTAYAVEIVFCANGAHAYPPAPSQGGFPYTDATFVAPDCRPIRGEKPQPIDTKIER